jgi:hypothetical protein
MFSQGRGMPRPCPAAPYLRFFISRFYPHEKVFSFFVSADRK